MTLPRMEDDRCLLKHKKDRSPIPGTVFCLSKTEILLQGRFVNLPYEPLFLSAWNGFGYSLLMHTKKGGLSAALAGIRDYARVRYRKVTTWALVQTSAEPNRPLPVPAVMPFSTAHATGA